MSWLAFFRSSLRGVGIMFTILRCEETVNTKKSFVIRSSGMLRNFREQVAESFKLVNALDLDEYLETAIFYCVRNLFLGQTQEVHANRIFHEASRTIYTRVAFK